MPYIVLDGIDGCGKDTQAELLRQHFVDLGENPLVVNEPYTGFDHGRLLRQMLQAGSFIEAHPAMFLAARLSLLVRVVQPALKAGRPVISCRSFFSTLAYQQENWPLPWLLDLHRQLPVYPDRVVILDLTPEEGMQRIRKREELPEFYERLEVQRRNRQRYLDLAVMPEVLALLAPCGGEVRVMSAMGTPGDTHQKIREWFR